MTAMTSHKRFAKMGLVAQDRIDTPVGGMVALASEQGLAGLWFEHQIEGELPLPIESARPVLAATRRWLQAYWATRATQDIAIELDLHGTPFQLAVWQALLKIGQGRTRSYGEIAAQVGSPSAVRAAGAAIGANPVGVIVPCHRVIGRNGSLTGYAGGLPRKEALLRHEGILLT